MNPLQWGLSETSIKMKFPTVNVYGQKLQCGSVGLQNFSGDCGALILTGANNADIPSLKLAREVASANGFNKIFATVVMSPNYIDTVVKAFKHCRWKLVHKGKSNRTSTKDSYVFVKIISNCKYKGY
jgi:hypothetical protein